MPDLRLDLLIQHVAEAIGAARIADTAIGTDVIPNLSHLQRSHPQDIRKLLGPDKLFETRTLVDLEVLAGTLERAIRDWHHRRDRLRRLARERVEHRMDASDARRADLRSRSGAHGRR